MTFGSLFAGIGGFDLGFERAGMTCKWQVEIDPYCQKVLAKHWPDVRRHDDVRTFPPTDAEEWRADVICGGDPCQANSVASAPWGAVSESFGGEFIRVVDVLRPRIVVRENPSVVKTDAPWPWWRFRRELELLGYAVLPFRLRSCCLGAHHRRDRLFLLGELTDADSHRLQGLNGGRQQARDTGGGSGDVCERQRRDDLPAPRICRSRNEVADFVDRVRAIGNAVDPHIAQWIGRRIVEATQPA